MNQPYNEVIKSYMNHIFNDEYEKLDKFFDPEQVTRFHSFMMQVAEKMEPRGLNKGLYRLLDIKNLNEFKSMSSAKFYKRYISSTMRNIPKKILQETLNTFKIEKTEQLNDNKVKVIYSYLKENTNRVNNTMYLTNKDDQWYVDFVNIEKTIKTMQEEFDMSDLAF